MDKVKTLRKPCLNGDRCHTESRLAQVSASDTEVDKSNIKEDLSEREVGIMVRRYTETQVGSNIQNVSEVVKNNG